MLSPPPSQVGAARSAQRFTSVVRAQEIDGSLGTVMVPVREPKTYSILLADEMTLVREGLAALCQAQAHFDVIGQCAEGAVALRLIETERPDIAVLDLNLPDLFTLDVVRKIKEINPATKVVVLSTRRDRKTVVEALRCGVSAFLLKSGPSRPTAGSF